MLWAAFVHLRVRAGRGYPELDYATEFPEKRYDDPDYVLPKVALIIGKDPLVSNPDGLFGHALVDMMKRGTELIVVDPRATWLATRAKYFLQLRPAPTRRCICPCATSSSAKTCTITTSATTGCTASRNSPNAAPSIRLRWRRPSRAFPKS